MKDSFERPKAQNVPIGAVINIGVNEGTPFLMRAFPNHRHLLVEPIPDYLDAIKRNYRDFDFELLHVAVNDVDGVVHIESECKLAEGKVSHSRIVDAPNVRTRKVQSLRLDTLLAGKKLTYPELLKIEVRRNRRS